MTKRNDPKPVSFALVNLCAVLVVCFTRVAYFLRLSDNNLVKVIPDDAFYYLEAARNFARSGRWSFDQVEPSSGFHLLWGYLLALSYRLFPAMSLHVIFLIGGVAQSFCLAVAAFLVTKTAQRLVGRDAWSGVLLIFLSAASLLSTTWLMETALVIVFASAAVYLLMRTTLDVTPRIFIGAFCIGLFTSLSRSDSGILVAWITIALLLLWKRTLVDFKMVRVAVVALLGACLGIGIIALHTHWISGQWLQASAQQKMFWSTVSGRSIQPATHIFYSFFNPLTNSYASFTTSIWSSKLPRLVGPTIRVLLLLIATLGLILKIRTTSRPDLVVFTLTPFLTVVSYCIFYRYNSDAVQGWYVGNFEVPAGLLAGVGFSWFQQHFRRAAAFILGIMCISGALCSIQPICPWQEAMWRAGLYLRSHPEIGPVGSWNAGIIGYFSDNPVTRRGVINMDGLMNDAILPYAKQGSLERYFIERRIQYVFESPQIWEPAMARRGGYADGTIQRCIESSIDLFPDDPDNNYAYGHIQLYKVNLRCLEFHKVKAGPS